MEDGVGLGGMSALVVRGEEVLVSVEEAKPGGGGEGGRWMERRGLRRGM